MTIHTRLHMDQPKQIDSNGECLICATASGEQVGRLLDLDELLEQAREEVRERVRVWISQFGMPAGRQTVEERLFDRALDGLREAIAR